MNIALNDLQDRNNGLKFHLAHEQLNCGSYPFNSFRREMSHILNEYSNHKSLFKAASTVGISLKMVLKWYIQGQRGNPQFRIFYLRINHINARQSIETSGCQIEEIPQEPNEDYKISRYGDGWSYTTYVGDEKVFIISNDLDTLKDKVRSRNHPID